MPMKVLMSTSILLASIVTPVGVASSDTTKPEQSTWRQAQSGKYLCLVPGAQSPSMCVTQAECTQMGGVSGRSC